ncbi:zinc finger protein castor homolog 1 isoform X3 [Polypterus senegalus]|uniref:zinc finger protein castor homolog 1 isoform X3 n=1 Tax=Polypterus senegalus TaxID=55291 RepID=UPI00196260AE|nr:zinc finger protein castor homolog 1 isoform X3 [Polypterus senegalus]XP_039611545.1 zinc finger protein castor homolog 1 isoform X3 [Polypterus senegalus]XP_039611546.1 zinc finger protein castor homolog 1 isoform X3 [Polypterus senegalus]
MENLAERTLCTETTSGKSKMAAKRKGGLKLNAICAKLSRQVVNDCASQQAEGDVLLQESTEREALLFEDLEKPESDFPDGLSHVQDREEDKRRREAIEKWVNGEYSEDHAFEQQVKKSKKSGTADEGPPEGVYMVQPKGCSDDEDNEEDPEEGQGSQDGSYHDDRDSEGPAQKEDSYNSSSEPTTRPLPFSSPGEASSLRDYAANTMNEFLGMFGYDDQQVRDELAKKISFEKLKAATSESSSLSSEEVTRRARFSKYEEYIRKLKAGETLPWPVHAPKSDDLNCKLGHDKGALLQIASRLQSPEGHILPAESKPVVLPVPPSSSSMQSLASRASKYDFFIQKLKTGESLRPQNGNTYKRPSKYDLENVKYLHLFKPGEGNPDMGGAIAFKTGKVGRPSKYDIRNIQKLMPVKTDASLIPQTLSATSSTPVTAGPATVAVSTTGPSATSEQSTNLNFSNPDYMKSSFSKTDSITTGTVSTVKNGLPAEKTVTEDVNLYQKYIARFSGSQHCGHLHCAYQYREHYHCLDPECNYQRFTSKQDVIRHYNMHKKRDNSLQHGFMRFSPLDDCSVYYHGCHLNGKSTHYHCMQVGCNKVYTSTSDVMTHENFHKKNAQLINDGFQRFRATEDCGTVECQFYGQKTTHFHCRRPGCTFTFKNKCDIEKHKSYHIKDDAYAKDGFKKFYKYEECKYEGCVYSKATNHFHCIRAGCGFTFTSTSQMTSHKRKHERRHIRSSGVLGLSSSFLVPKEEPDDSSNDDLMDFSAISSKNSSLSASPTTQPSSSIPLMLPTPTTTMSSSQAVKPTASLSPASKMSTLLTQALPSTMPVALTLSNPALSASNPFFPIIPRLPLQIPVSATGLICAASSNATSSSSSSNESIPQSGSASGESTLAITSSSHAATSIVEKISASKGLISPMMARLAAAAFKPAGSVETGNGLQGSVARFNLVQVKQEPLDGSTATSQDSLQEKSLDLSKKEQSNESNGHPAPGNTSLLSSLMNKISQANAGFFNTLNIKSEMENSHVGDGPEAAQFLGQAGKAPLQEKTAEFWKTYLRRFDTEDFCEATCDFLHKCHFHCLVEDCGALFSTLDGAIKHANFHFRAAVKVKTEPLLNPTGENRVPSDSSASQHPASAHSGELPTVSPAAIFTSAPSLLTWKQLTGSIPQLPASVPSLGAAASQLATTSLENAKPQVKPGFLQFQDNDPCLATDCKYANKFHFHCLFGNCKYVCKTSGKAESHCLDHINPNNNLMNVRDQFAYYSLQCLCPNQQCEFRMRGHYHCLRPNCCFVTNITTKLPWHIKKHEKAERRAANGFKYFTKREECGRLGCKYNQVNSHFHCIREGCQFSFLLKHQMTSHARKHMRRMLGKNFDRVPSQVVTHSHRNDDLHPVANLSMSSVGSHSSLGPGFTSMMDETDDYMDYMGCGSPTGASSESSNLDRSCSSTPVGNESSSAGLGCLVATTAAVADPSPADPTSTHNAPPPPLLQPQPPSFPQALLRPPLSSLPYLLSPSCLSYSLLSTTLGAARSVAMPTATPGFSPILAAPSPVKSDVPIVQDAAGNTISMPTASGAKKRFWIIEDMSPFGKRRKTASSRKMLDEGMMLEGFRRYDLYEDCKDAGCQFSLKVTHYHCTRENCGYKFCGRTHMYKHAQHHDRVDNLVLDDFKRFKSSLSCNFADCQFSGNSTHFHCLRCEFRCTDSTKVTAHRKHHGKQDVINAAGFCQFSSSVDCEVLDCKYKLKCSHFHCTYPECKHTVVGMSQMDSHKRKHEKQERGELPSVSPGREVAVSTGVNARVPPASPGPADVPGSTANFPASSEYGNQGSISLDSSLNLGTDANSSLFFLKNAVGIGLNDSLDLSKKVQNDLLVAVNSVPCGTTMQGSQDEATATSGEAEDDLSNEEEMNAEDDDDDDEDDDDDDEEDDDEEDDGEEDDELNTDSYEDSVPEPESLASEKENGVCFDASSNHTAASGLPKKDPAAEP